MSVPFSERSAGFIWFFSFIVKFAQVTKEGGPLVILLDEPGLTLHGKAQGELLRYFEKEIVGSHQLLFTTHSPFMVPTQDFSSIRIVEDKVYSPRLGKWASEGTKVRSDALAVDRDTLFPLQGALGYEVTQALFVGKNTLLVEGPGDILYLNALSSALLRRGRPGLSTKWTLCPAGGLDKVQPFVSLFSSAQLNVAVLTDFARVDHRKLENLRRSQILQGDRVMTFAGLFGIEEADVEDIFASELYARMLNEAFSIPEGSLLTAASLGAADPATTRQVKKAEAAFRVMPPGVPEFDHYTPAEWLFTHSAVLDEDTIQSTETLARAEIVFSAISKIPVS
jgi:predicted ATP-dependent endonuclease of OLD family